MSQFEKLLAVVYLSAFVLGVGGLLAMFACLASANAAGASLGMAVMCAGALLMIAGVIGEYLEDRQ